MTRNYKVTYLGEKISLLYLKRLLIKGHMDDSMYGKREHLIKPS